LEINPPLCYIFQVTAAKICLLKLWLTLHATAEPFSGRVAQLAEHSALNRQVVGSIPTASTKLFIINALQMVTFRDLSNFAELRQTSPNSILE
jgi:hypothetical protein